MNPLESRKRKETKWKDEDYYSSDDDTFLDRTGSIEKKREKRMRLAGRPTETREVLTLSTLNAKCAQIETEIHELEKKIENGEKLKERTDDSNVDIDDYLSLLKSGAYDVKSLRTRLRTARDELNKTIRLAEKAKPAPLPAYLQLKHQSRSPLVYDLPLRHEKQSDHQDSDFSNENSKQRPQTCSYLPEREPIPIKNRHIKLLAQSSSFEQPKGCVDTYFILLLPLEILHYSTLLI